MADKNKRPLGLYLHFPFCVRKCRYCDFLSFPSGEAGREIYLERLKEGYALQYIKMGHNKAVKVATFLSNKRMVIKEGKEYKINPDSHY